LFLLKMTSGQGVVADTCAPALDFEKRRLATDEVVNLCEAYQGKGRVGQREALVTPCA
jgi:hypothetical protein